MKSWDRPKVGKMAIVVFALVLAADRGSAQPPTNSFMTTLNSVEAYRTTTGGTFSPTKSDSILLPDERRNALGLDILLSNSGFGLGLFYRRLYTPDLHGFLSFSISEVKDDREIQFYDPFTGGLFTPGKVHRFLLLPLFVGGQYRLFREEIADNFRPYVSAALGPTMVYATPYEDEFFSSLGKGQAHYTIGGYAGFGAFFGQEQGSLVGLSFRYYFVNLKNELESMRGVERLYLKAFGGFFITLNIGTMY